MTVYWNLARITKIFIAKEEIYEKVTWYWVEYNIIGLFMKLKVLQLVALP